MLQKKSVHGKVVGDTKNNRFVILIEDDSISVMFLTDLWQELIDLFDIEDDGSNYFLVPRKNLVNLVYNLRKKGLNISISTSLLVGNLPMTVSHGIPYTLDVVENTNDKSAILAEPEIFQVVHQADLPDYLEFIFHNH